MTSTAAQTAAAIRSRRLISETMSKRVEDVLCEMRREQVRITVAAVARRAGVSRTFLYQNDDARRLIAEATAATDYARLKGQADAAAQAEATWKERALNAEEGLKEAFKEVSRQRTQIGELLGQIRDLELDLPKDAIQRTLEENTALRKEARQLRIDNRRLEERLQGARNNCRSLDSRVAELEAQILHSDAAGRPER